MTTTTAPAAYTLSAADLDTALHLHTATDVVDFLAEHIGNMIVVNNYERGALLTEAEFDVLFARTFDAALPTFLDRVGLASPGLGAEIRRQFVAEQDDRDFHATA